MAQPKRARSGWPPSQARAGRVTSCRLASELPCASHAAHRTLRRVPAIPRQIRSARIDSPSSRTHHRPRREVGDRLPPLPLRWAVSAKMLGAARVGVHDAALVSMQVSVLRTGPEGLAVARVRSQVERARAVSIMRGAPHDRYRVRATMPQLWFGPVCCRTVAPRWVAPRWVAERRGPEVPDPGSGTRRPHGRSGRLQTPVTRRRVAAH